MYHVIYANVKRKAFDEVADLCSYNPDGDYAFHPHAVVRYNGTHSVGDMMIEVSPGESKIYKALLVEVAEILSKY